ncbi:MAG: DUF1571 domain-containing protein [Deltaproteobacteria bacterium]|nr:MAG: DUF1571 domain-containing protein [Deltaproteobacteria bacterium]
MLITALLGAALAVPPTADDAAAQSFADALRAMNSVAENLTDATFTMHKREWVDGGQGSWSVMEVKFRQPEDAYLHFVDGPNAGRMVLWKGPDWNNGKFRVDPGRFIPVMSLDPNGSLAMRGNRHNIRELPPTVLIEKITRDALKVNDSPTFKPNVTDLGTTDVRGESSQCWEAVLPKEEDKSFYATKVRMCVNPKTNMVNSMRIWDHEDGEMRLVEQYDYVDFKINPGLSDQDFDPDTYGL